MHVFYTPDFQHFLRKKGVEDLITFDVRSVQYHSKVLMCLETIPVSISMR